MAEALVRPDEVPEVSNPVTVAELIGVEVTAAMAVAAEALPVADTEAAAGAAEGQCTVSLLLLCCLIDAQR